MKWASAISRNGLPKAAVDDAAAQIRQQLGDAKADLVLVFASSDLAVGGDEIPTWVQARFPGAVVVGTNGGGVIGAAHEEEELPAIALTAASLPEVQLAPFHVDTAQFPAGPAPVQAWHTTLGVPPTGDPRFVVFADPFTCDVQALLRGLDRAYPRSTKVGGLSSGGRGPGGSRLFLAGTTWRSGAVGVAMKGRIRMDTLVAQGCRPVGTPMLVTRCEGPVLLEVNQRPALEALRALHASLPEADRELMKQALFLGVEMKGDKVEYGQGDFLVRNIVGMDPRRGAIAVGADLQPYQVVQFMVRDAKNAEEDLARMLGRYREQNAAAAPSGALLFSCMGRGRRMFGREDHDTGMFQDQFGLVPLGGFFCNGEIGPVGNTTFLHTYTSAFALFRPE